MEPIVHGLEQEHGDRVDFQYIDREDPANAEIVEKYDIRTQPIFILIDENGVETERWFGVVSPEDFEAAFDTVAN